MGFGVKIKIRVGKEGRGEGREERKGEGGEGGKGKQGGGMGEEVDEME